MAPPRRRHRCPDCDRWLVKEVAGGKYHCHNPVCPVIWVRFSRHGDHDAVTRIVRAADPRDDRP